ncbi:TadE/TadG family type IV pilus assembly protein [Paenibacillus cymbidii]|uniref:TadE/TadG family type IV pilus assembly protein n=1 Tax=Paenibacillus cymbidii TaxID=1639034 RepID=UPI00108147CF|nr:TadE family protein [Paenibacillus cymbidii]
MKCSTGLGQWLQKLAQRETGSYTVEATLAMPLVLLCTALIVVFGLYMFDRAAMYRDASAAAERTAYGWNRSVAAPSADAGMNGGASEGLYWRWLSDGIGAWFGIGGAGGTVSLSLPVARGAAAGSASPPDKLRQSAQTLPAGMRGTMTYTNKLFEREVTVRLERKFAWSGFAGRWLGSKQATAVAKSVVVDPQEWIRTVDLVRTYVPRVKQLIAPKQQPDQGEGAETTDGAGGSREPAVTIRSEAQASAFIRALVGGEATSFPTEHTGEWRVVDALDRDGVAHEAKYTVNQSDAKDQVAKDAELMKGGYVKGVVWHFFRHTNGSVGLTESLRSRLYANGIVAIVHN